MNKRLSPLALLAVFVSTFVSAQDISGTWQGTLSQGEQHQRVILKFEKNADGEWTGKYYSPDSRYHWGAVARIDSVTLEGDELKFMLPNRRSGYAGKLSRDGNSMEGTMMQGQPQEFRLERATPATEWKDPTPHRVQFVTVDKGVKLEVLDYGGSGRPLVFLAGGGLAAHVWDSFAPRFVPACHVYAITRRGFGDSSAPGQGYLADRLGDDVLAVLDALKLDRPVLVGHSIAGEELSSVGSRHPQRVSGLIYLDSAYSYAYYDSEHGDIDVDLADLRRKLAQLQVEQNSEVNKKLIHQVLDKDLPQYEADLRKKLKELAAEPADPSSQESQPTGGTLGLMFGGFQKYTSIPVPILAIYAYPHALPPSLTDPKARAAMEAEDADYTGKQADALAKLPNARVVRLAHADHAIFQSNEEDVLREMNAFLSSLH